MSSNHSNLRNHHSHYICEEHMDDFCDRLNYYLTGFRKSQNKVHNHIPERANLTNEERYLFVFKQIKRCIYSRFSDLHLQEAESFNKNENKNRESPTLQSYIQLINDYVNHLIQNPNDYWKHFTNQQYSTQIADEVKNIRNNTNVVNKKRQPFYILTHIAVIYSLMKLYFLLEELCKRNFDISTIEIRFTRNKNYQIQYENVIKKCIQSPNKEDVMRQIFYLMKSIYDIYYGTYIFIIHCVSDMMKGSTIVDTHNNLFLEFDKGDKNKKKSSSSNQVIKPYIDKQSKFVFFICDEFFGSHFQEKINKLQYQYVKNKNISIVNRLKTNSNNYLAKTTHISEKNQVQHFLQLPFQEYVYEYIRTNANCKRLLFYHFLQYRNKISTSF